MIDCDKQMICCFRSDERVSKRVKASSCNFEETQRIKSQHMPSVLLLCLLWSFGLLAFAAKPHDGRNGLPPVTLLFRLNLDEKAVFCGIQEPKEPALVSESEWLKLLASNCHRLVGLSETEFEKLISPHFLPKVFEYIVPTIY